jgi:DNA-binding NarL/FixJ family response regulator
MFLYGLKILLQTEPDLQLVGTAQTGAEALQKMRELTPDVALVNLRIKWLGDEAQPSMASGLRTIQKIAERHPQTPILVVSSYMEQRWVVQAMNAGAKGFLAKESDTRDIVAAIRATHRGRVVLTAEQMAWLRQTHDLLTEREQEVLVLMAEGIDDAELAARLQIKITTVRKHVENLRTKLQARNRLEAVIIATRRGFL